MRSQPGAHRFSQRSGAPRAVSGELLTTRELVERLARDGRGRWSAKAVHAWIHDQVAPCPVAQPGRQGQAHRFDYGEVCAWLEARDSRYGRRPWTGPGESAAAAAEDEPMDPARMDPRVSKAYWEGERARLQALELAGKLVPVQDVEVAMARLVGVIRAQLLALPSRLDQALAAADATGRRAVLEREVDEVLVQLSQAVDGDAEAVLDEEAA